MKNIEKIHEDVFTFLNAWSEDSRINASALLNAYFYMRSVRDDRFKKGFWFPGNDNYLCISFWAGGDSINKTPSIYFEINEKVGCRLVISAKDSDIKRTYFEKLIADYNRSNKNKFILNKANSTWSLTYTKNYREYKLFLDEFIKNDKTQIDNYIQENEPPEVEEFVSKFGFIASADFDSMISRVKKEREDIKITEQRKHQDFIAQPKLPFALTGINIENFQGIKYSFVTGLPPDARWIFITGENGYGKTTLLQAVALGLSGDPDMEKYIDVKTRISAEIIHHNEKAFPVRAKGRISQIENIDFGRFVIGYGPARLNVQAQTSENMETKSNNNVSSLFDNTALLKNINYELFASTINTDNGTFEELAEIIRKVTKGRISNIVIVEREAQFVETLSDGDTLDPMPLAKLAAGFRSIINVVFDIYLRLKKIHPGKNVDALYGIVIIDEIENHLHPILQRELPITLSGVFPNVQFIVSTHSPIPLLGAEKNSIILKIDRTKDEGVIIERLDEKIEFRNLLPNTILTSPIFGFDDIISVAIDENENLETTETFDEVETMKKLRDSLKVLKVQENIKL